MLDTNRGWNTSFKTVFVGFALSLILTLLAYYLVVEHTYSRMTMLFVLLGLGSLQAVVQLVSFFHLGMESSPKWNLIMFLFLIFMICVIVGGTLWIMYSLNSNMMPTMNKCP